MHSQHVRLIDESINNGQANCVDGSVLLASLLRKIDIEPELVYVPGHCYMAFFLDAEKTQRVGLETTLIGGSADDSTRELPGGEAVVDEAGREKDSWATFCAAVAMGNDDIAQNKDKFNLDDPDYQIVSIAAARQLGILPIAFDAGSQFESVFRSPRNNPRDITKKQKRLVRQSQSTAGRADCIYFVAGRRSRRPLCSGLKPHHSGLFHGRRNTPCVGATTFTSGAGGLYSP